MLLSCDTKVHNQGTGNLAKRGKKGKEERKQRHMSILKGYNGRWEVFQGPFLRVLRFLNYGKTKR